MADRTWEERSKWMDRHRVSFGQRFPLAGYVCYWADRMSPGATIEEAVDAAMDRSEREAAERAKAEQAATAARARGPVAALLKRWEYYPRISTFDPVIVLSDLRAAIDQQCADWTRDGSQITGSWRDGEGYAEGYKAALRRCASDLSGSTGER